jgi:hypothetical protein
VLYICHSAILDSYMESPHYDEGKRLCQWWWKYVSYLNINWQSHWLFCLNICKFLTYYTTLKMAAFWGVALCSLVDINWCFRGAYCLHHYTITVMMEAVSSSETLDNIYLATRCNIPEDSHLPPWEPEISHCTTLFCVEGSLDQSVKSW